MKKLIFITLLSLLAVSGWGQNYVRLGDAIAITPNESDLQKLELAIDSIHLVLPEGMQDSFKVFDFSYYIFNEFMVGLSSPAIWDEKIIQVSSISKYFILFGREYNKSDEKLKWRVKIKLPEGSEYRCSNPEQFQIIENYLISSLNSNNILATNWSQAEINELKHAKIHINKLYNCCDANRTSCDSYDILNIDYLSGILKNYEFTELKEITFLFNGSYLGKAGLGHRSGSFFSEQSSFLSSLSNAGLSGSFQNIFLQIHTVFKHNEGAPPKITQDNWNLYSQIQTFENYLKTLTFQPGLDYKEQNIIIYHDGKYRVFTRISRNINWDFTSISSDEKDSEVRSAIIPALIARWVVKKIWQAGVGIVIGFTMDVVVEKYFTYDHDCNWGSAIRYTFQKTEPYKYLLWAAESWLDSSVSAVFMGAMTEGASYLFTVSDGGFSFDTLFDKMLYGGLQGFLVSKGLRGLDKVYTRLSNQINLPIQEVKDDFSNYILQFLKSSNKFVNWKITKSKLQNSGNEVILDADKIGLDEDTKNAAKWIIPETGFYDIVVHGEPDHFKIVINKNKVVHINHRNLANYMKSIGYKSGPVRLISCQTGVFPDAIAKHLANKLGVTVKAPTDLISVFSNGSYNIHNNGRWREFHPGL